MKLVTYYLNNGFVVTGYHNLIQEDLSNECIIIEKGSIRNREGTIFHHKRIEIHFDTIMATAHD